MANTDKDADLQALLDLDANGNNIQIIRRVNADSTTESFYVQCKANRSGNVGGKAIWVDCTMSDTDATKNTAIRAALGVP